MFNCRLKSNHKDHQEHKGHTKAPEAESLAPMDQKSIRA